jgi:D-alanine-D-alanine ligase
MSPKVASKPFTMIARIMAAGNGVHLHPRIREIFVPNSRDQKTVFTGTDSHNPGLDTRGIDSAQRHEDIAERQPGLPGGTCLRKINPLEKRESVMRKKKINVGIIFGGKSAEHEVSLQSARNVIDAIDKDKYNPILIGIDKSGRWLLNKSSNFLLHSNDPKQIKLNRSGDRVALIPQNNGKISNLAKSDFRVHVDVAFPILHGPFGEDGTVQGLLKLAGIPFVGSGVLGSAIGMDKDIMKRLLRDAKIPIPRFMVLKVNEKLPSYASIAEALGTPFFVKPANLGSSVGVSKVSQRTAYESAAGLAFEYDNKILIEQ